MTQDNEPLDASPPGEIPDADGVSPDDRESRHQMILMTAYYRAARRGFAAPELRDRLIRAEAKNRKLHGKDADVPLSAAESDIDRMLQGCAEVEEYLACVETLLVQWDGRFRAMEQRYDTLGVRFASAKAHRAQIENKLAELRAFHGEVWGDISVAIDGLWKVVYESLRAIEGELTPRATECLDDDEGMRVA